jgi:hypothetical protein
VRGAGLFSSPINSTWSGGWELFRKMGSTGDSLPKAFGTTRRLKERGGCFKKPRLYCRRARCPFRPASRRASQARGPLPLN